MNTYPEVFAAIDRTAPIDLLARLVQIPSHPGVPRQEEAVVAALARYLSARGLESRVVEVVPGRPNLNCTVEATAPGVTSCSAGIPIPSR